MITVAQAEMSTPRTSFRRVAAASVCYVVVFAVLARLHLGGQRGSVVLSDVSLTLAPALGAAGCFWGARRVGGRTRLAWLLVGIGSAGYSIGAAIWAYYEIVLHTDVPFPAWSDPFYLSLYPFVFAGLLMFPSAPATVASRLRSTFDGLLAAGAVLYLSWTLLLGAVVHASSGGPFLEALGLAYPIGDVILCVLVVIVAARISPEHRTPFALLAVGLVCYAVVDSCFAYLTLQARYVSGNPIDVGWAAAGLLVMLAGISQARDDAQVQERRTQPLWMRTVLPYLVLLPTLALGAAQALTDHHPDPFGWAIIATLIGLLVLRQFLTLAENVSLTGELRRTLGDLRAAESDMRHQAFHDALTGLANRALFRNRITHAVAVAQRKPWEIAVLFLDLDDFKTINDTLGHAAGDELLVEVGSRLRSCIRDADTAARMGGDEFAVLLEDGGQVEALRVAQRMSVALDRPFELSGREVVVRASVGIATPADSLHADAEELLRHADLAMYSSKYGGKGRAAVYEGAMGRQVAERLSLKADLTSALLNDEFTVYLQPVVELTTGRVTSVEALARWRHPRRGLLAAQEFIGLAEESGLIVPLGNQILNQACAVIRDWHRQHPGDAVPLVSVNLSGRQLADPGIVDDISVALLEHELQPSALILEITENTLTVDTDTVVARLHALKALGVGLAIDNFGTGQSSLANLDLFPVDILKMDRNFVAAMTEADQGDRRGLAAAVLRLGAMLDLQTVAAGVEQPWQLQQLRELGCPAAQGYLLGAPQPATAFSRLLRRPDPSALASGPVRDAPRR